MGCSLKNKITNVLKNILDKSRRKPNKTWMDKGSEFYNRSMKPWMQDNGTEMYSTNNKGKYFVAEIFIRALKNRIINMSLQYQKCVYQ